MVLCPVCVTSLWFGCGYVPCLCHQPVVSSDIEFPNIDDCLENYLNVFTVTVTNTEDRNKCMFPSFLSIQSESAGSTRVNIHRAMNLP